MISVCHLSAAFAYISTLVTAHNVSHGVNGIQESSVMSSVAYNCLRLLRQSNLILPVLGGSQ